MKERTQQKDNYVKLWIKMFNYDVSFSWLNLKAKFLWIIEVTLKYLRVS